MPMRPPIHGQRKPQSQAYAASRAFLTSAAWRKFRLEILTRDLWTCQECRTICTEEHQAHVDHILPRHTHPQLALDPDNCHCLCDSCHAKKTIAEDGEVFPIHFKRFIISGLPASGKTYYVSQKASVDDAVWDMDALVGPMFRRPRAFNLPSPTITFLLNLRRAFIQEACRYNRGNSYIIITDRIEAARLAKEFNCQHVHIEINESERQSRLVRRNSHIGVMQ